MTPSTSPTIRGWISPEQIPLLEEIVARTGFELEAVGHDGRGGQAADIAKTLNARAYPSFREFVQSGQAEIVFLGVLPNTDHELLLELFERASHVFTLEPIPDSIHRLSTESRAAAGRYPDFLPLWRTTKSFKTILEAIESSEPPKVVSLTSTSLPDCGSLGARLFDAMDAVFTLLGVPETIDAVIHGPRQGRVELQPGQHLRSLRGELTAHIRGAQGRSATITLSDRAGAWSRTVTALGDAGIMRCHEHRFDWTSADGEIIEKSGQETSPTFAKSVTESMQRALDIHAGATRPVDLPRVLAMAEAALLSARTGQPESPVTMMRLAVSESIV
jgi:hypothetical protein